jgi:hypothetical protein
MQELMNPVVVVLLGMIAYFLKEVHAEMKRTNQKLEAFSERLVKLEVGNDQRLQRLAELHNDHEKRLVELEQKN